MTEWQDRVVKERDDLYVKVLKLEEFLGKDPVEVSKYDLSLLKEQLGHMREYYRVLGERIMRFNIEENNHD